MNHSTRLDDLSSKDEYKLLREYYDHLRRQINCTRSDDTSLVRRARQTEITMIESRLKMLQHTRKKLSR